MDKLSIKTLNENISFGINKIKLFLGRNYIKKLEIVNQIKKTFDKVEDSEYILEAKKSTSLKINDTEINLRKWKLIEINSSYGLNNDLKLGSKSLVLMYLESLFRDIEYNEIISTLRILESDLIGEMNDILKEDLGTTSVTLEFEDITIKRIMKQVTARICHDSLSMNQYDLLYDDIMVFQLRLLKQICLINKDFSYLTLIEIPFLTDKIAEELRNIQSNNVKLIVVTSETKNENISEINEVLFFNKKITDLQSDESIYNDIILNVEKNISLADMKVIISDFFKNIEQTNDFDLEKII
ncbi:MAG: hypothetical protein RBQ97_03635 [Acholeplasma sp.]|nr:hypothetical protein [Acholeplasma sp.]